MSATPGNAEPRIIVLIHGLWTGARGWEWFRRFYESHGYQVLTPEWPGRINDAEAPDHDPAALAGIGIAEIAARYDCYVRTLHQPAILMGHGFGGLIVQMLLDRGVGEVGVAVASVPPKGVARFLWSAPRAYAPILVNPMNAWQTTTPTFAHFQRHFARLMSNEEARVAYERYVLPGPGRPVFQAVFANLIPWMRVTKVDYANADRAPLLLIAGSEDHQVPAAMVRENHQKYARSEAVTDYVEFAGRSHLLIVEEGWREVAAYALSWAKAKASEARLLPRG